MNNSTEDNPVHFVRQKILQIRSALFFCQHDKLVKIPTSIVTVLRADENGVLWFFVKRPLLTMDVFANEFPVRLEFFRKKAGYHIQVWGKAFIVQDNDVLMDEWADISPASKEDLLHQLVLLKVKMMNIDYFDKTLPENRHWAVLLQKSFYGFLAHSNGVSHMN